MLKFYFSTVVIYAIIILSAVRMTKDKIIENGWLDGVKANGDKWTTLFCFSAVPVIRIILIVSIFMMASKRKDDDFWNKKDD